MGTICLKEVSKKFKLKGKKVIEPISNMNLEISLGEEIAIVGQSGAGKSTLLNIISLIDVPSSGEYYIDGMDVISMSDKKKANLRNTFFGVVMQEYALIETMSVFENVRIPLVYSTKKLSKEEQKKKIHEVLEKLGIGDKMLEPVNNLSGGQRQRVAIARAIINEPTVIVADEPTSALDDEHKWEAIELLRSVKGKDKILIIVTHDREISAKIDRVIDLDKK